VAFQKTAAPVSVTGTDCNEWINLDFSFYC
jgi:hypothetical protein